MSSTITLQPIGTVVIKDHSFYLSINPPFRNALQALEGFSHIHIIWWGNQSDSPELRQHLIANKPYNHGPEAVGIFATRSEIRPNPVLITVTAILNMDREQGVIELPWIDAAHGTPILDIKPYQPCSDRVKQVHLPDWCANWPQWHEDSATFDWNAVFSF